MSATMTPNLALAVPPQESPKPARRLMTTEELLAMPDDGVERWLINGELRERPGMLVGDRRMTIRNRFHSKILAAVSHFLEVWRRAQPEPRGEVLCGEAGVRLRKTQDSTVGMDVVYIDAQMAAAQGDDTTLIDGAPVLAVEILSPNDVLAEIEEKIDSYLAAEVALVWVINPIRRTVTVYRRGAEPVMLNTTQELSGDPHLPGFRVAVAHLFE